MLNFDAVIFDLDGVITKTALVHGSAWKKMFDDFLLDREKKHGEPFKEFTHADDYLPYVDGKPRYKGVQSFLDSRGIEIPFGSPEDGEEMETVCGLGNRKNKFFNDVLDKDGVEVYDSTVKLIKELKDNGIRIGVASSSKNCKPVLESAELLHLFETRIDGVVSVEMGLNGKPEPDIFTTACDELGVKYSRSVVVEDAVSGVQAGAIGNFGLTIGVAREDNEQELENNGADIVVTDLAAVSISSINEWFETGIEADSWILKYYDYNLEKERSREALLAVGNGYFGTRGALEESRANKVNYPGTYVSGLYNRLTSKVAGRDIENEDFVNIPNWLPIRFRIEGNEWFEFLPEPTYEIEKIHRYLNFKTGELNRLVIVKDSNGKRTKVESSRFASMEDQHLAGLKFSITPLNYSGKIEVQTELNGNHINAGVERYKELNQKHLEPLSELIEGEYHHLVVKTTNSNIKIAQSAKQIVNSNAAGLESKITSAPERDCITTSFSFNAEQNQEVSIEKLVTIYTSMDEGVENPSEASKQKVQLLTAYSDELEKSKAAWSKIWDKLDIKIEGDRYAQKLLRMHLYHSLVSASPHYKNQDTGIGPRGLHGEAYRGHIFWDELYILPLFNIHFPDVVKSVLQYRFRRLDKAREYAKEYGYEGAMFPWQSGSDGREETQVVHLNPISGEWGDDYSSLQRHVSLAIAYNIWNYYWTSDDLDFMIHYGAEMFFEICRFWASKTHFDEVSSKYHIDKVMGPDEFHESIPGSGIEGLEDNGYTNIMASWAFTTAIKIIADLPEKDKDLVFKKINLSEKEINTWRSIKDKLNLEISEEGIVSQFNGYFGLKELDWQYYNDKYGDIHRLDRILKSEDKSPDEYKLSKQADFLMTFYNLPEKEVSNIITNLGYKIPDDYLTKNFDYYIARTSHGSTLSRLVHASIAYQVNKNDLGWKLFMEALESDYVDIQGGTTGEGIHCGVMAGTSYTVLNTFAGLDLSNDYPGLCPNLPSHWEGLKFNFSFRKTDYQVSISNKNIEIIGKNDTKKKIKIHICGQIHDLPNNKSVEIKF